MTFSICTTQAILSPRLVDVDSLYFFFASPRQQRFQRWKRWPLPKPLVAGLRHRPGLTPLVLARRKTTKLSFLLREADLHNKVIKKEREGGRER